MEVELEYLPFLRLYKGGRVERYLFSTSPLVPASLHPGNGGVRSKDVVIPHSSDASSSSVPARIFLPEVDGKGKKLPLVLYFHGGGFLFGSAFSVAYHAFVGSLAAKAKAVVVSVEYRLAPEHPLPAAYTDALHSLRWVSSHADANASLGIQREPWVADNVDFSKVFLAGDSAGGNMAHNIAMQWESRGTVTGALLLHPFFWGGEGDRHKAEMVEDTKRMLQPHLLDAISASLFPTSKEDPRINPLTGAAPGLEKLACRRVLVAVAGKDLLCESGRMYYQELVRCGWAGEAELHETEGEDHIFHIFNPDSHKARAFMVKLASFINREI